MALVNGEKKPKTHFHHSLPKFMLLFGGRGERYGRKGEGGEKEGAKKRGKKGGKE